MSFLSSTFSVDCIYSFTSMKKALKCTHWYTLYNFQIKAVNRLEVLFITVSPIKSRAGKKEGHL